MTKSTITREQLEEWVAQFDEDGGCDATDRQLEALIRQSLAAMDSEPVAYTEKHEISNMHATGLYLRAWPADRARNSVEGYTIPLYTTPQPISLVNSEPVAYIFKHPAGRLFWALTDESNKGQNDVMPVYASPQPAPAIPDGYVMVPKEPTSEMVKKMRYHVGSYDRNIKDGYKAMLAAAPQSPGSEPATVPGKWIPVSERMPEVGDIVLTAMGGVVNVGEMECSAANCRFFTSVISGRELPATHWMPLPAGPQEASHD